MANIKIIIGENNSGKSRYLRKQYNEWYLKNKPTEMFIEGNELEKIDNKYCIIPDQIANNIYLIRNEYKNISLYEFQKKNESFYINQIKSKKLPWGTNFHISYKNPEKIKKDTANKIIYKKILKNYIDNNKKQKFIEHVKSNTNLEDDNDLAVYITANDLGAELEKNIFPDLYKKNIYSRDDTVILQLQRLIIEDNESLKYLNENLKDFDLEILNTYNTENVILKTNNGEVQYTNIGEGYQYLLYILYIFTIFKNKTNIIYYIDEYSKFWHPDLERKFLKSILKSKFTFDIYLSTHTPNSFEFFGKDQIKYYKITDLDTLDVQEIESQNDFLNAIQVSNYYYFGHKFKIKDYLLHISLTNDLYKKASLFRGIYTVMENIQKTNENESENNNEKCIICQIDNKRKKSNKYCKNCDGIKKELNHGSSNNGVLAFIRHSKSDELYKNDNLLSVQKSIVELEEKCMKLSKKLKE